MQYINIIHMVQLLVVDMIYIWQAVVNQIQVVIVIKVLIILAKQIY